MASSFMSFQSHTKRRTTFGRTYLDEWSACCRDPYLGTHNTHNRKTSMPPAGYEPTISAGERPQELRLALCSHRDRPLHVYPNFFFTGRSKHRRTLNLREWIHAWNQAWNGDFKKSYDLKLWYFKMRFLHFFLLLSITHFSFAFQVTIWLIFSDRANLPFSVVQ